MGTAGQGPVAHGGVVGSGLTGVGVGPGANDVASLDKPLDFVEVANRVVNLEKRR